MLIPQAEFSDAIEREMSVFDDYRNGIGHIVDPHDLLQIVWTRLAKRGLVTEHNEKEISHRLTAEWELCAEAHLEQRMQLLRFKASGSGLKLITANHVVREARRAFTLWFKTTDMNMDEYETHSLLHEITLLEAEMNEREAARRQLLARKKRKRLKKETE